jgi:hypothetical protein
MSRITVGDVETSTPNGMTHTTADVNSCPDTDLTPLTQNRPRKEPKCILLPPS